MSDWSEGYVTEIGYTYGYYQELNPVRLRWALLAAGYEPPAAGPEGLSVCELGFGQGVSLNMHAAAQPGDWWGTDFNPGQVAFARKLAAASGAPLRLHEDAFSEFAERRDLPEFDVIALHGIWSWVSDENRRVIVQFLRRRLKTGGLVLLSYNALPGWASGLPLRELMLQHARTLAAPGAGPVRHVEASLEFAERLIKLNPDEALELPPLAQRLEQMRSGNKSYLVHEFLNQEWRPMFFREVAECLEPAKLTYGASAHLLDHVRSLNFTPEQLKLLQEVPDPVFRETLKDYCANTQFRRDIWLRGALKLATEEAVQALRASRVVLLQDPAGVKLTVSTPMGESQLRPEIFQPVLEALAGQGALAVAELEARLQGKLPWAQLLEALTILIGMGAVAPAQSQAQAQAAAPATARLNRALMELAVVRRDVGCLASPVTGGGLAVSRIEQMMLRARSSGAGEPQDWARAVASAFEASGERLLKDGQPMPALEDNVRELRAQAERLARDRLPLLQVLGIV